MAISPINYNKAITEQLANGVWITRVNNMRFLRVCTQYSNVKSITLKDIDKPAGSGNIEIPGFKHAGGYYIAIAMLYVHTSDNKMNASYASSYSSSGGMTSLVDSDTITAEGFWIV